jgi:hypothetical protein
LVFLRRSRRSLRTAACASVSLSSPLSSPPSLSVSLCSPLPPSPPPAAGSTLSGRSSSSPSIASGVSSGTSSLELSTSVSFSAPAAPLAVFAAGVSTAAASTSGSRLCQNQRVRCGFTGGELGGGSGGGLGGGGGGGGLGVCCCARGGLLGGGGGGETFFTLPSSPCRCPLSNACKSEREPAAVTVSEATHAAGYHPTVQSLEVATPRALQAAQRTPSRSGHPPAAS